MKLLLTGDWQCRVDNLDRCRLVVEQIVAYILREAAPVIVVHLGDIKDAMNPVDQRVTNFIMEAVDRISREAASFLFIRGNHDSIATQDGVPSCIPVVNAKGNIAVADNSVYRQNIWNEVVIWMVPYFRDPARQRLEFQMAAEDARKKEYRDKLRILAFHNEVSGCERNAYSKGTGATLAEVGTDAYDFCISGHIHRPQIVYRRSGGLGDVIPPPTPHKRSLGALNAQKPPFPGAVYYPGSPFPMDWGECNEEKSFLVLDTGTGKVERIPSAIPGWYDPDAPGFHPPKSWKGTRVRVHAPPAERLQLQQKYPGAELVIIPELPSSTAVEELDLKGGDAEILKRYLKKLTPPAGFTLPQMETFIRKHLPDGAGVGVAGIRFGKVKAVNTLCFESVNLDFDQKGMTLVTGVNQDWQGSNGSGKSSLVSLPFLALCGRTFKNQTFDAWANNGNEEPAQVIQHIVLSDGRRLRITRNRRPGGLRIYLDDEEISMGKAEASQNAIEQLTNLPWSVLTNAVYIGQREVGSVFGTEKERKELFSRLLGLERFLVASEKIRKALLKCKQAVGEKESEVIEAEASVNEAINGLEEITTALSETAEVTEEDLQQLQFSLAGAAAAKQLLQKKIDLVDAWLKANQKDFETALFAATDLEVRIQRLTEEQKTFYGLTGDCPTCGTRVDIRRMEKRAESIQKKIAELEEQWEAKNAVQNTNRQERKDRFEKLDVLKKKLVTATSEHVALLTKTQIQLEQLKARTKLEKILNGRKTRIKGLGKIRDIHKLALWGLLGHQNFIEQCLEVVGRDGLPSFLTSVAAPALNLASQEYSEIFSDGKIGVTFDWCDGDIDIRIRNENGGADFQDQSAGESRMAGIIAVFAFREVLVRHNILILDEPGEGLDATNAAAFARGLKKVIGKFEHVLVVTHNPYILGELEPDRIWEVEKQNGIAEVKEV